MFCVEVVSSDELLSYAIDQWTRELPIKAARGRILSSDGTVLAANSPSYAVYIRTKAVSDAEEVASVMEKLFAVDGEKLLAKIKKKATSEITVARHVDKLDIIKLTDYELDGVYYSTDASRVYPYGDLLCNVIGYTSSDGSGQSGLESYFDKYLKGVDGEILYEADLTGDDIDERSPRYTAATDGLDVVTNIDIDIQLITESALKKAVEEYSPKKASAVVLDGEGRVLAMASLPSYDLNDPPRDDIELLNSLSRNTMISDTYEPGSTFKIITAAMDIEEYLKGNTNAKSLDYVFPSSRYRTVAGGKIKCWSDHANGKHSGQTLQDALNNSCNPCFTDIALSLGKEVFYDYIENFGFGKTTGVDFPAESCGMLINESAVTEGDLARIAFGQSIAVTPIALAAAALAAVNGGNYYTPQIVGSVLAADGETVEVFPSSVRSGVISAKASAILASYLESVVTFGSGKKCYIEGYKVGGKTGTAQKYENGKIAQGKYVMSFIGFFPSDDPRYLCLVTVDEPEKGSYGSTVAAPVAREILEGIINAKSIALFTEVNYEA